MNDEPITDWEESGGADTPAVVGVAPTPPPDAVEPPPQVEPLQTRHRHRARSQQAGPEDVPRIQELSRKLREAEAELTTLRGAPKPSVEATRPSAPTPPPVAPVEVTIPPSRPGAPVPFAGVPESSADPEPDPAKYDDYTEFNKAQSRWAARQEMREANERHAESQRQESIRSEGDRLAKQWKASTTAATAKYPDFAQVAYGPTNIPQGSLVDAWILEHRAGADVLYHLQKNPADLTHLLSLPMLDQVEALSLLAQRLSPTRSQDVSTGASAAPMAQPVPRPPTPVRTGPMRTGTELPGDDDSLEAHEKAFYRPNRLRRA